MTTADTVLGIDLGTSSVKAAVYGFDGVMLGSAERPVGLHHPAPGRAEQDLDEFYTAAAAAGRECLTAAGVGGGRVGAFAVAGQMAGVGLVDAQLRPVAPFDSWLDTRCGDVVDEIAQRVGARVTSVAGCPPTLSIGPKMVWWRRNRPDVCAEAAAFVTAAGYVAARAVGRAGDAAFIDPTHLHFTAVADVARARWDEDLVDAVGVEARMLPQVVESTAVVGVLTRVAAADFGLLPGTPIAAGCGDTAAAALGSGVTEPGQAFDVAGTAAVLGVCLPEFAPDRAASTLMTMRAALPGRWYSLAYVSGAGQVIEWLCREILGYPDLTAEAYTELARVAAQAPAGSDGVILSPHFAGRVAPADPGMRGSATGLSPGTGRAHLARAALESIAYEYRGYAELATAAGGPPLTEVVGTGGGSRLGLWNQIKADVLGVPYRPLPTTDTGTRGAALVALAAIGEPLPDEGPLGLGTIAEPDPTSTAAYDDAYARYRRWSGRLADGYREETDADRAFQRRGRI